MLVTILRPRQLAGVAVIQEQRVHACDHGYRFGILWIQFHRVDELAPRVRPTSHLHQLRPAGKRVAIWGFCTGADTQTVVIQTGATVQTQLSPDGAMRKNRGKPRSEARRTRTGWD